MIQFKDNNDNLLIEFNYITRLNQHFSIHVDFYITYISPLFNGEYLYYTTDSLEEPTLMYRLSDQEDFEFFDLSYTFTNIDETYAILGKFIDLARYATIQYNKVDVKTGNTKLNYKKGVNDYDL